VIWRLVDRAVDAEFPAVIEAADAVLLDTAQGQRGAPVHAKLVEQPDPAAAVAERDKRLAEQRHA
jgi:hypothetical protein